MLKVYFDASTKGNPGPSGGGILLIDQTQEQIAFPLPGSLSNHQAEFAVFAHLLDLLIKRQLTHETIMVFSDSKVLVQVIDKDHTNNPAFLAYLTEIRQKLAQFDLLILQWIPEKQNRGADNLARQGLQKALKNL